MNLEIKLTFDKGYLRVIKPDDVTNNYVIGLNDPEVNKYLDGTRRSIQTIQGVKEFIKNNLESQNSIMFGIWCLNAKNFCGTIRLSEINEFHRIANIGLCIFEKSSWGQGIGSKAIASITEWAMNDLNLRWIEAGIYGDNTSSQKAFLKAGYEWIADISGKYILNSNPAIVKIYAKRKVQD